MVGRDTPKEVSLATYKRHRTDRLTVSSYAEFLGHTASAPATRMVDDREGLSISRGE